MFEVKSMSLESISISELNVNPFLLFEQKWCLLTAGDFATRAFNCMTISWGSMGVMWNKPFIQVVVRPSRYTLEFIQSSPDFTVCSFPDKYRKTLQVLGSKSGRTMDKINASSLTPIKSTMVNSPTYKEANLIFECKKIYFDQLNPLNILDNQIEALYPAKDYHTMFFGEILAFHGETLT
jgi:flavin reductase (DIM6/NTAB) family NADH-FMN oxidoreductase RutF